MTTKCVTAEEHDVDRQDERADADAERSFSSPWIREPHRFPDINRKDDDEDERQIKKVAVHVLHDQREGTLAEIRFARFPDSARWRISPEGFVIGPAIIITGQSKSARRPKNQ